MSYWDRYSNPERQKELTKLRLKKRMEKITMENKKPAGWDDNHSIRYNEKRLGVNKLLCSNDGICFNADYIIVNSSSPAPKYVDGFICRQTGKPCTSNHYKNIEWGK